MVAGSNLTFVDFAYLIDIINPQFPAIWTGEPLVNFFTYHRAVRICILTAVEDTAMIRMYINAHYSTFTSSRL